MRTIVMTPSYYEAARRGEGAPGAPVRATAFRATVVPVRSDRGDERRGGALAHGRSLLAVLALLALAGTALAAGASAPVQVVEKLHDGMVDVMRTAASSSFDERAARLGPILEAAFDLDLMARKSLGRSFATLDEADRKAWIALFRRFMVANYAGRFTGYAGQHFETLGEEPAAQDTVLVRTRLIDPGGDDMDLDYRLWQVGGTWKIVDVYLKGTVSELALRRSDFTSVLDREGFAALVASVEAKIADLRAGKIK